jgi:hypothetical protein
MGGASAYETWHPCMDATADYRSVTGSQKTNVPGVDIAGVWDKVPKIADKLSIVRSISHNEGDHERAQCLILSGERPSPTGDANKPSIGSMVSNIFGPSALNGLPLYVANGRTRFDGGLWLGSQFNPFDYNSDARKNFVPQNELARMQQRFAMLDRMDSFGRDNPKLKALQEVKRQTLDIIAGNAKLAFEVEKEPENIKSLYGQGLGQQFLLARRLIQYGSQFVMINYGGWDNHTGIANEINRVLPPLDNSLFALITDLSNLGILKDTLILITTEFSRTPKVNKDAGRDHWAKSGTIVFAGGDYQHGRIIGSTDKTGSEVKDSPFAPNDVLRTVFHHFGIPANTQRTDNNGRPRYLVEGGKNILV